MTDSVSAQELLRLEVVVQVDAWPDTVTNDGFLASIAKTIAEFIEFDGPERAVVAFSGDAEVRALNARFRGKDMPTNVLSFPAFHSDDGAVAPIGGEVDAASSYLGDIILARETVVKESQEQGVSFEHHTAHLLIHGILHLLGYDHEQPDDAEEMEALEIDILAALGIDNPYTEELVDAG